MVLSTVPITVPAMVLRFLILHPLLHSRPCRRLRSPCLLVTEILEMMDWEQNWACWAWTFTIYDLRTKTSSQCELLVTHKLFSLATLDVSAAAYGPEKALRPAQTRESAGQKQQQQRHHTRENINHQDIPLHRQPSGSTHQTANTAMTTSTSLLSQHQTLGAISNGAGGSISSSNGERRGSTNRGTEFSNSNSPIISTSSRLSLVTSNPTEHGNVNNSREDNSLATFTSDYDDNDNDEDVFGIIDDNSEDNIDIDIEMEIEDNNNNNNNNNNNADDDSDFVNRNNINHDHNSGDESSESESDSDDTLSESTAEGLSGNSLDSTSLYDSDSSWSEGADERDGPQGELFVACAWNGVTYLIDWSKRIENEKEKENQGQNPSDDKDKDKDKDLKVKFQLVKFAFEGRVCAFTAGLYAVAPGHNVPCLFYVDFEDQIFVYYDVRVSPGPVHGFIDTIDDDVEETLERVVGFESGIQSVIDTNNTKDDGKSALHQQKTLLSSSPSSLLSVEPEDEEEEEEEDDDAAGVDLGDGWKGIRDFDNQKYNDHHTRSGSANQDGEINDSDSDQGDLDFFRQSCFADLIHECLYGFEDLKQRLEKDLQSVSFPVYLKYMYLV
ncbi:hypothetical protein F4703DRAFT_1161908 [Phycomyces blakesleeanus]